MGGNAMLTNDWVEILWTVLNVRPKTLQNYKHQYGKYLAPVMGSVELDEVEPVAIQRCLLSLPPQTSRHCLMLVKTIYREATLYGHTKSNPSLGLKTPSIQLSEKKFLTWEEVDSRSWGRYDEQIRFLALHGLRWSEAAVITEHDIRDGFVFISKSVYGPCKSKSSIRKVPYLGHFAPLPVSYKPMQKTANLHGVTVHSFRRTYAYLLKTEGIHVTTAQKLLGHSDPLMTLKVYTSVLDDEIDAAGVSLALRIKA
jgi:integrase